MNSPASNEFNRPAFQALDVVELARPGLSKVAVVSLALGLASLLAILSQNLLMLSVIAIGVGVVAVGVLSRSTEVRGIWLAQAGLALGVVSGTWSVTANNGTDDYLYLTAGKHAEAFLGVLSQGRVYEALELTKSEAERQIVGTDLEKYYASFGPEEASARDDFLNNPAVVAAIAAGPAAEWKLIKGIDVGGTTKTFEIEVELANAADGSSQPIRVHLRRSRGLLVKDQGAPTALWFVYELKHP